MILLIEQVIQNPFDFFIPPTLSLSSCQLTSPQLREREGGETDNSDQKDENLDLVILGNERGVECGSNIVEHCSRNKCFQRSGVRILRDKVVPKQEMDRWEGRLWMKWRRVSRWKWKLLVDSMLKLKWKMKL